MKKGLLIIMLFLIIFLSSCGGEDLFDDFHSMYYEPEHYVIGYGTETHFEIGTLMPEVYMVYHDGEVHYEFHGYIYIPKEDGTYDVIDTLKRPTRAYNLSIEIDFEELAIDDFDYLLKGKTFFKSIVSTKYKYEDEVIRIWVLDELYDSLSYEVMYSGQETIYSIRTISENEHKIPSYEMDETTGNIFSDEYTLEKIEDDSIRYNVYLNTNRMAIDFGKHNTLFYMGDIIEYDFRDGNHTNLTRDTYICRGEIKEFYGNDNSLFLHLNNIYLSYRLIVYGETNED